MDIKLPSNTLQKRRYLVTNGYIRSQIEELHYLKIPFDIKQTCYKFLSLICDEWDPIHSHPEMEITDNSFKLTTDRMTRSVYGKYIVKNGDIFQWNIGIKSYCDDNSMWHSYIGVIQDIPSVLKQFSYTYDWYKKYGYQFGVKNKQLRPNQHKNHDSLYGEKFMKNGDTMSIILNLKNYTLSYIINGNDYGVAFKNIKNASYRLAISMSNLGKGSEFEFC